MLNIRDYLSNKNSVYIIQRDGSAVISHNISKQFRSASVIKIFILAYYLEQGSIDETLTVHDSDMVDFSDVKELYIKHSTVRELLTLMIGSSDNTATNVLIKNVGMSNLNAFISERLGAVGTVLARLMLDEEAQKNGIENLTCLVDVKKCLDYCLKFELGRTILATQKCRDRIMRYIYKDVEFYGKAGEITGVFNDVGYVDGCFVGVLSDGMSSDEAAVLCGKAGLVALNSEKPII